ncbi:MAG TPA: GAF domain-containing protein, partial [Burkholderiales bacterium]|nr:GAF domain-containing protein [Burkholderiales bacterium]
MKAPAKRRAWAAKRPAKQEVDRFELAMRAINEGIYEWNIADGSTVYSDRVLRSLGLSRRQLRNAADWHQRIHPEDRARFDAALRDHFKGRTERFECDLRYRAGDGGWRWARQHGVAIRDAKGRAVRMIGSTGDITELKRVEEALKASEERYALATRAATEGIYEWNLECDSLYLSDRAKAFFAVAGEALTPAAWNARVHGEDFQGYRDAIVAFFKGRKPVFEHEYRIRDAAGGYAWVRDRAIAVRDPAGRVTRFVGALTDITQRRRAELELRRAHESTTEALARQTATAEILKAIAASPTDVRPVLEALARHAGELCGAAYVNVLLEEESMLRTMAVYSAAGGPPADTAFAMRALPTTVNGRAFVERRPVHVPDFMAVAATEYPDSLEFQRHFGFRTILGVPMLRAGQAIGTISIWRREVRPFSAEEIALIETFAAQAVIAIENVRLFNETKEALEQQTASSEILRVISSSPADLAPVFDAILGGAMQLCEAHLGTLNLYDGEWLHTVAQRGGNPQFAKWLLERGAIKPDGGMVHQAITERRGVQIADAREAPGYREGKPNISKFVDLGAVRTFLAVPLLKDSAVIGIIGIYRPEVRPFSEKQIALVSMFANQAVIAIENARLFNETREALERQTATAEILKVIARSPADVQPVFDAIVTAALKLCAATSANAVTFDGELIHVAAVAEAGASAAEALGRHFGTYPKRPSSDTANTRAILTRQVVAIPDVMEDAEYAAKATAVAAGYRSIVSVPLMRGQNPIGALTVARPEPGHFPERKLALLRTFADQAAIAIENARLFNETKEALEQQTATTNILHVISRSVTDLAPVFEAILENAITLCEGNVAALWQYDGTHLRFAAGKRVSPEATAHYRSHPLALGT